MNPFGLSRIICIGPCTLSVLVCTLDSAAKIMPSPVRIVPRMLARRKSTHFIASKEPSPVKMEPTIEQMIDVNIRKNFVSLVMPVRVGVNLWARNRVSQAQQSREIWSRDNAFYLLLHFFSIHTSIWGMMQPDPICYMTETTDCLDKNCGSRNHS